MARVHFRVETPLSPAQVLAVLTDFGPERAKAWPNIDEAHFKLHEKGPGWAHVTEGSSLAGGGVWEEERYSWDADAGTVAVETLRSNTWGPGSRWDYRIKPGAGGGSKIEVDVVRNPMGFKAGLISALLSVAGPGVLRGQMQTALDRVKT
jgi:Polyketide cyclase / dehydrase and lipid transport